MLYKVTCGCFVFLTIAVSGCAKVKETSAPPSAAAVKNTGGDATADSPIMDRALLIAQKPLPDCNDKLAGKISYLITEKSFFMCVDKNWSKLDLKGKDGIDGKSGTSAINYLMVTESFASDTNCPAGGKRLLAVPDRNANGIPEVEEKTNAAAISTCNPVNPIVRTKPALQADCPAGGQTVITGNDLNGDGLLNDSSGPEKDTINSVNICNGRNGTNGRDGTNGQDGAQFASKVLPVPKNFNPFFACRYRSYSSPIFGPIPLTSFIIAMGPDLNRNGSLDSEELPNSKVSLICGSTVIDFNWVNFEPLPEHFKSTVAPGELPGQLDIKVEKGDEKLTVSSLVIARREGAEAPTSCYSYGSSSDDVYSMTIPQAELSKNLASYGFKDFVPPGKTFSYLICGRTPLTGFTRTVTGVTAKSGRVACAHTLILTEPKFNSYNLGGFSGADAECRSAGSAPINSNSWKAVLSGANIKASERIRINGVICNSEGQVIAADSDHLFNQPLSNLLTYSPSASQQPYNTPRMVLTGSDAGGGPSPKLDEPEGKEWTGLGSYTSYSVPRSIDSLEGCLPLTSDGSRNKTAPAFPFRNDCSYNENFSLMCISGQ